MLLRTTVQLSDPGQVLQLLSFSVFNRKRSSFGIKCRVYLLFLFDLLQPATVPQGVTCVTLMLWKITG